MMMTNGNTNKTEQSNVIDMRELLKEKEKMVNLRNDRIVTMMMELVANELNEPMEIYDDKSRKRNVVVTKQMVSYAIRNLDISVPLSYIAVRLKSHHATVIHSVKTFDAIIKNDPLLKQCYENVMRKAKAPHSAIDTTEGASSDFYHINLNDCISIRFSNEKSVILSGYTMEEALGISAFGGDGKALVMPQEHTNTGFYILERKVGGEKETPSYPIGDRNPPSSR